MKPTVNICDGCCCGRNKSNLAVPKDELKTLGESRNSPSTSTSVSPPASGRAAVPT